VAIGSAWIIGLNHTLQALLPAGVVETIGVCGYVALVSFLCFFGGGFLIGYFSQGTMIKEAALTCTVAVLANLGITLALRPEQFNVIGAIIALAIGFGFGLAGGWVGERLQGDTTEKLRERGGLPPRG
jgi:hypothetical protein